MKIVIKFESLSLLVDWETDFIFEKINRAQIEKWSFEAKESEARS